MILRQLNATEADAQLYGRLASSIIYRQRAARRARALLIKNRRGQSGLWGYGISGDLPIVLLQIARSANIDLVRQLVQAHAYWRLKGLAVDLVIWNEDHAGYRQQLQEQIMGLIAAGIEANVTNGRRHFRAPRRPDVRTRIAFCCKASPRHHHRQRRHARRTDRARSRSDSRCRACCRPGAIAHESGCQSPAIVAGDLLFFNGIGGFTPDGHEYVITTSPGQTTPAPWVNVLANPNFGTVVSESGRAYTWSENAHEFRLTPWYNDPVSDSGGEAFYLRDEETGHFWSPTPLPAAATTPYVTRHGFGYSVFEHTEGGISSEMWVYVAIDAPVKFAVLKVTKPFGPAAPTLATGYVEWVLGDLRPKTAMYVTHRDRPQDRRPFRAQSLQHGIRRPRRFLRRRTIRHGP